MGFQTMDRFNDWSGFHDGTLEAVCRNPECPNHEAVVEVAAYRERGRLDPIGDPTCRFCRGDLEVL